MNTMKALFLGLMMLVGCDVAPIDGGVDTSTAPTAETVAPQAVTDPVPVQCGDVTCAPGEGCNRHYIYGGTLFTCGKLCGGHSQCDTGCCYPQADCTVSADGTLTCSQSEPRTGVCTVTNYCDHARGNGHDVTSWWPAP